MYLFPLVFFAWFVLLAQGDTECPSISGLGGGGDRRKNKNVLRLVQYNVEWLFIDPYEASSCPGSGCSWANETEAETHLKTVASVISDLDPDILNLCEVEGCDELNMLISAMNKMDEYVPYLKEGTDTSTGQNVGLITKLDPFLSLYRTEERVAWPIIDSQCGYFGAGGTTGVSKHYITQFRINNVDIAFIGAHLLAYPTDPTRCAEREAQAVVLQHVIASYIQSGYEIIFLGDLNDYDGTILDANNDKPISKVLSILKEGGLYSVAETIVQKERYSDWYDKNGDCISSIPNEFSMIDHILVTDALRERIVNSYIYHGYSEFCETYNSDHYPVVVEFSF